MNNFAGPKIWARPSSRILASFACALAIAGCSNSGDPNLQPQPGALTNQDRQFLIFAQQSSTAEINAANVALKNSVNPAVTNPVTATPAGFAPVMIRDHTTAIQQETPIAAAHAVSLPGTPLPVEAQKLVQLSTLTGTAFDAAYSADQVSSHQATLAQVNQEIASGSAADVVAYAKAQLPIITMHLQMAQALQQSGR